MLKFAASKQNKSKAQPTIEQMQKDAIDAHAQSHGKPKFQLIFRGEP
jgi:hypothetical protein